MNKEQERRLAELEEEVKELKSSKAKKPSVVNVSIVSQDTEYPHKLPIGCKRFQMQMRDATAFRFATVKDLVAKPSPPYFTVKANTVFKADGLDIQGDVWLYLACDSDAKVVEILQWS